MLSKSARESVTLNLTKGEIHFLRGLLESDFEELSLKRRPHEKLDNLRKIMHKVESLESAKNTEHAVTGFRSRELEWRRTHRKELKQYAGQWVILEGNKIIAHGDDPETLIEKAKTHRVEIPYIFFVEQRKT